MTDTDREQRSAIIAIARSLDEAGLVPNKSGNVSCRSANGFLITPAGVPYAELSPEQIVKLSHDGSPEPTGPQPSSEWRMHQAIYALRPDAEAIVHTHSPHATALACAGRGIPAFHYMIALAGGDVRCTPYATFGTAELAVTAVRGLEDRRATLLANHGVVALGASLRDAFAVAVEVENLARQYLALLAAGLDPMVLSDEELERVVDKFGDYGRLKRG
jgi:L-fuculose-phosphate aldolase